MVTGEQLPGQERGAAQFGAAVTGERGEEPVRRHVVRGHGGLDEAVASVGEVAEHAAGQRAAAPLGVDGDLPDEERPGVLRTVESGYEATDLAVGPRDHGGRREVTAPEDVAVRRIQIQGFRVTCDAPHLPAVLDTGRLERLVHSRGRGSWRAGMSG